MELGQALSQISEIHGHLARSEVYRGLHPAPVMLTGVLALAAAAAEPHVIGPAEAGLPFVHYWIGVAALSAVACGAFILYNYCFREDGFSRRRTRKVLAQFLPCLAAGIAVTAGLAYVHTGGIGWLPGFWAVLFSLGIFAARPSLPRAIGFVGLFYLGAGSLLLWLEPRLDIGWGMGLTFGIGQLAAGLVLHSNIRRDENG